MNTLTQASQQWASRPDDERFTSLPELASAMRSIRERSQSNVASTRGVRFAMANEKDYKGLVVQIENDGAVTTGSPSNWAFDQFCTLVKAPASYLRGLPSPLTADNLNYGLQFSRAPEDVGVLTTIDDDGGTLIRAATGPRYGRIWNADIAEMLMARFGDGVTGQWRVPGEFGKAVTVTKENTTIYAGDRDMFVFLADENNRIEVPNRRNGQPGSLARGFFVWNSEVGKATVGVGFFLFDYVCCNRIVWGAEGYKEISFKHYASAPYRWMEEINPVLREYSEASAKPLLETIETARQKKLDERLDDFLATRFGKGLAPKLISQFKEEEGRPIETLWDVATAATAYARTIPYQDKRVELERQAGDVLKLAA